MTEEQVQAIVQAKMDEINRSDYSKYEALIRRMDAHGQYIKGLRDAVIVVGQSCIDNSESIIGLYKAEIEENKRKIERSQRESKDEWNYPLFIFLLANVIMGIIFIL